MKAIGHSERGQTLIPIATKEKPKVLVCIYTVFTRLEAEGGGLLFIKINLQTRLLIVTRLVNEA